MNDLGAITSGGTSSEFWSVPNAIGVIFAANVNVMLAGYGLSTSGGMSVKGLNTRLKLLYESWTHRRRRR